MESFHEFPNTWIWLAGWLVNSEFIIIIIWIMEFIILLIYDSIYLCIGSVLIQGKKPPQHLLMMGMHGENMAKNKSSMPITQGTMSSRL